MRWRFPMIVWFVIACASVAGAAQYVVDPNGDDTKAGTAAMPWKTLQHAADVVGVGDTVTVRAGNYVGFDLRKDGAPGAPIQFVAQPGAAITSPSRVRHDAQNNFLDGINLEGASYIVIDGFTVNSMPEAGVRTVGFEDDFAKFVTVRNVHAANNKKWGIFTGHVNDLLIENNLTSGSIDQHGIYVSNSGDRPVIRNNVSWDNHGSGIHMNGDESQGGDGIISNAVISGNLIYNNAIPNTAHPMLGGGSGINMDGVQSSRIENNLVYNNHASGISLYMEDSAEGAKNNIVVNNTIHQPIDGRWALNIQMGSSGNTVRNNILLNEHGSRGAIDISQDSLPGFSSDYNVIISRFTTTGGAVVALPQWQTTTGQDAHSKVATASALFANAAGGDYHLLSSALAVNGGTSQFAPAIDLEGHARPAGSAYDVGAYEFGSASTLAGDYNHNGTVDAADYALWRDTIGQTVTAGSGADGNSSGTIDTGDYTVWISHFGQTAASASVAAPEPTSISIAIMALIAAAATRPKTSRKGAKL